jgi:polyisoprenoid-binding protein YceI
MQTHRPRTILLALSAAILALAGLSLAGPALQEMAPPSPASGTYAIDAGHSFILFKIKHLDTAWAFGRFNSFSGKVVFDDKSPEKCSVEVRLEMDSVDTGIGKRDDHIRSGDFFDAEQFPTAHFNSKSVKKGANGKYAVTGDLELHGVTKPVTIDLEVSGASSGKRGTLAGFYGTFSFKRSDFGMSTMLDALSDEVHVIVSLETAQAGDKR